MMLHGLRSHTHHGMSGKESPGPPPPPSTTGGPEAAAEVEISTAETPPEHMVTSPPPQVMSPITQLPVSPASSGGHPQVIQGPQPLANPQPPPPKLSPHEIQLITEAAAKQGPNGTYQCSLCNKNFGYKNGLVRHIRLTHVGEKPYECNICHRRFGYKHILMEHQNLHFGNRPYACTQCDKKFAARSNLIQHRMVHKRPFQCAMCNKRFDKEDQLKKHMYAHPQTMLQCTLCKKNCNNENDLKKHIAKVHPNELHQNEVKAEPIQVHQNGTNSLNMHLPQHPAPIGASHHHLGHGQQPTEPISPPAGASPDGHAQAPHTPPGHTASSPGPRNMGAAAVAPPQQQHHLVNERGHRIDAICSQLVTSISQPPQADSQASHTPSPHTADMHHGGVIIKKELDVRHNSMDFDPHDHSQSPRLASTGSAEYHHQQTYSQHDLSRAAALYSQTHLTTSATGNMVSTDDAMQHKQLEEQQGLPGIHEMFSRKPQSKLAQTPPPPGMSVSHSVGPGAAVTGAMAAFASAVTTSFTGMPTLISSAVAADAAARMNLPHGDLPLNLMSPPPPSAGTAYSSAPGSVGSPGASLSTARHQQPLPTQLSSNHHQQQQEASGSKMTSDQAVQHYTPIPGFPSLDDVITYYVNQGAIFKCQHCNIVFFERGMFFLHSSLHSSSNPWECSICNKVCGDRNEFTLHFVNQQHT